MVRLFLLLSFLFFGMTVTSPCFAQNASDKEKIIATNQSLDSITQKLNRIEQSIAAPDATDAQLLTLRSALDSFPQDINHIINDMTARLESIQNRLDQLGPAPTDKTNNEDKALTHQREELTDQNKIVDALLKRARLLTVEVDQAQDTIAQKRRQIFAHTLFGRSSSILDPTLWVNVLRNIPFEYHSVTYIIQNYYEQNLASKTLSDLRNLFAFLLVPIIFFFASFNLSHRLTERFRDRYPDPHYTQLLWHSLWIAAIYFTIPVITMLMITSVITNYNFAGDQNNPLIIELTTSTMRLSFVIALTHALLSPRNPQWRLFKIDNSTANLIQDYTHLLIGFITFGRIGESVLDLIAASLTITIALKGLLALCLAGIMIKMIRTLSTRLAEDECLGPRIHDHRYLEVLGRLTLWIFVFALLLSSLLGYSAFSSFLIDQLIWNSFLAAMLFFALEFNDKIILTALTADASFGRLIMSTFAVRRESLDVISIILSGLSTLVLSLIFILFALAPWGVESDGIIGTVKAAFFGFKVGDITISLSDIVIALFLFLFGLVVTRSFQNWLDKKFLPRTELDVGLRNSIRTSLGYLGFFAASSLALVHLGLNFEKLAIVAGALSVGIGFGLQSIVNNFVSGLILLWERAIRVGDWIVVGDEQGYVKRINVRSTEIETFDRATMIVPNSNLVTGTVKNWVRTDRVGRIKVLLSVGIHTNPDQVRDLLLACAHEHDLVLKIPAPQVIFTAMTDTGLKFELVCFVSDVEASSRTKSDLHFEIFRRFKAAGLEILTGGPPAPTRITIEGLHEIMERASR